MHMNTHTHTPMQTIRSVPKFKYDSDAVCRTLSARRRLDLLVIRRIQRNHEFQIPCQASPFRLCPLGILCKRQARNGSAFTILPTLRLISPPRRFHARSGCTLALATSNLTATNESCAIDIDTTFFTV